MTPVNKGYQMISWVVGTPHDFSCEISMFKITCVSEV